MNFRHPRFETISANRNRAHAHRVAKKRAAKSRCDAAFPSASIQAAPAQFARSANPAESQIRHTPLPDSKDQARHTRSHPPLPSAANHENSANDTDYGSESLPTHYPAARHKPNTETDCP